MSNLGYLIAAYAITLGALAGYGLLLWSRLRQAEQNLGAVMGDEGERREHQ